MDNASRTTAEKRERLLAIIREKSLKRGSFVLASGAISDYYLDLKPTSFDPEGSTLLAEIVLDRLKGEADVTAIGGPELGAVPIVAAVTQLSWPDHPLPGFVVRKEKKGHGTDRMIDPAVAQGAKVVLIEDVTTTGGSVLKAINAVRALGGTVKYVLTVIDRLQGAGATLGAEGVELVSIYTVRDVLG